MDAFAVSVCKGLALQRVSWKECCIAGAWFGGFQALMPLLGYLLGTQFEQFVTSVDHWIAFVLLGIIGGNMIREALSKDEDKLDGSLAFKTMLLLAIATSIDALAVGITFAFLPGTRIVPAVALIGTITFAFSAAGIRLGSVVGLRFKRKAEFAGGGILILLGTKILLEHLGITFAFLPGTRIVPAVALIGSITFVFSAAGIRLGNVFGLRYKSKAEFAGGVILILLGTKILLEHLGVL